MKKLLIVILLLFTVNISYSQIYPFAYWKTTATGSSYEQQADSLFARMTSAGSTPSANRKTLINTTIKMLKDSLNITSLYKAFDLFYVMAARDTIQAKLNWVNSSYTLSGIRINATFVADSGYLGNVGSEHYLKTGYIPNTHKVTFVYNSSSIGGWITRSYNVSSYSIWGMFSNSWTYAEQIMPGGTTYFRSHTYQQHNVTDNNSPYTGLYTVVQPTADSIIVYKNTARLGTASWTASSTLGSNDIWLLARNADGTGDNFSNTRICFFFLGKKFNSVEVRMIYNILKYYLDNCSSNT